MEKKRQTKTKVAIEQSFELFISHYQYGHNYEDSTLLLDPSMNIIAFHDRGTKNIDVLYADIPFKGGVIVDCVNKQCLPITAPVKYNPTWYDKAVSQRKPEIDKLNKAILESDDMMEKNKWEEQIVLIKRKAGEEVREGNRNFFKNLIKELQ